jgi:hypothetical protein
MASTAELLDSPGGYYQFVHTENELAVVADRHELVAAGYYSRSTREYGLIDADDHIVFACGAEYGRIIVYAKRHYPFSARLTHARISESDVVKL